MKLYVAFEVCCDRCGRVLDDPSSDCETHFTGNLEATEACIRQGWKTNGTFSHTCPECQRRTKRKP